MKKLLLITLSVTALAVTALLSCSKDQGLNPENQDVALSVKAGIMVDPSIMTKSIITGTTFANGAVIGVQVLNADGASLYKAGAVTNIPFTLSDAANTPTWTPDVPFYMNSASADIFAYFPYDAGVAHDAVFTTIPATIGASITTGDETDYMYSSIINNAGAAPAFTMNHALAQVSFKVYKENYSGTGEFTKFTIAGGTSVKYGIGTMAITGGAISLPSTGILTRTLDTPVILGTLVPAVNATTLTVPTGVMAIGALTFTFTIDEVVYTTSNAEEVTLAAGSQYIYTILLSGTEVAITSASVGDWSPGGTGSLGIN